MAWRWWSWEHLPVTRRAPFGLREKAPSLRRAARWFLTAYLGIFYGTVLSFKCNFMGYSGCPSLLVNVCQCPKASKVCFCSKKDTRFVVGGILMILGKLSPVFFLNPCKSILMLHSKPLRLQVPFC